MKQLGPQNLPFAVSHRLALGHSLQQDGLQLLPLHGTGLTSARHQYVRLTGDHCQVRLAGDAKRGLQLPEPGDDVPGALQIQTHRSGSAFRLIQPPGRHGHVPPLEVPPQTLPQGAFQRREQRRDFERQVEETVVDGTDLHAESPACHRSFPPTEPGHTESHEHLVRKQA